MTKESMLFEKQTDLSEEQCNAVKVALSIEQNRYLKYSKWLLGGVKVQFYLAGPEDSVAYC